MRTISLSPTDLEIVQHERYHHPHPRVQEKMEVLWLKSQGLTHEKIGQCAGVSRRTVQRALGDYRAGGIDQVRKISFRRPTSELLKHKHTLEDYFLENPPASAGQAQAVIEKVTGVEKGLLDIGADDTVFPDVIAAAIGIDLSQAPTGGASGVGAMPPVVLHYAEVVLRISDGQEHREWPARVGFTSAPLHRPLLGYAGFLQFFTSTFHGDREVVELTVNAAYPGK